MVTGMRTPEHNARIGEALKARGAGESPTKHCPRCKATKPRDEFGRRSNGHSESYCIPCKRAYGAESQRRYVASRPELAERRRQNNRRAQYKRKYGITVDEYEARLAAQDGRCAICRRTPGAEAASGRFAELFVDHDHATGAVRGLLCHGCNAGVGLLGDDPARLLAAADYLSTASTSPGS